MYQICRTRRLGLSCCSIIRPPDIVGRLRFYHGFFSPPFFVSCPPRSLNRTQPKLATCSEVSAISKYMSEICGIPSPYESGVQNHPFRPLQNLTPTLMAYTSEWNTIYTIGQVRWQLEGSPISSQNDMNFGPQTASNWTEILPTLRKFCFLFHCQTSLTEISKRNSTKLGLCQTVDSKSR